MMHKSVLSALGVALAVSFSAPGIAQDSEGLLTLLPNDPNGFVQAVQEKLISAGLYSGRANGTLTQATISAINAACRTAGVLAECQIGPLSPEGSAAIVAAIGKISEPDATAAETPAPEPDAPVAAAQAEEAPVAEAPVPESPSAAVEAVPAEPDQPPAAAIAGSDWKSAPSFGLTATQSPEGDAVEFEIAGSAEGRGWINMYAGDPVPTTPGVEWSFTVDADFASASGGTATAYVGLRAPDGSYLTELVPGGVSIEGSGSYVVKGTTIDGAAFVQPYIQVKYPAGTTADGTLSIKSASFGRQ